MRGRVSLAGTGLIDPGAAPVYRGMVLWRGLLPERDTRVDALDGCDLLRPVYQGGHGIVYYIPGSGQGTERGKRLLMWGYYLQVPESTLASVLVDDQERQQSGSVPFGKVHPEVRAGLESRLADLLPPPLFELVQQSGNSSIQAIYSYAARSYARDRLCLAGDAGTVLPPFTGSGVLRAVAHATSLTDALAGAPAWMMLCIGGVRPSSRSRLSSFRSLNASSGATYSICRTSLPCQPRRPTTGCRPPFPGSRSPSPAYDSKVVGWLCS